MADCLLCFEIWIALFSKEPPNWTYEMEYFALENLTEILTETGVDVFKTFFTEIGSLEYLSFIFLHCRSQNDVVF